MALVVGLAAGRWPKCFFQVLLRHPPLQVCNRDKNIILSFPRTFMAARIQTLDSAFCDRDASGSASAGVATGGNRGGGVEIIELDETNEFLEQAVEEHNFLDDDAGEEIRGKAHCSKANHKLFAETVRSWVSLSRFQNAKLNGQMAQWSILRFGQSSARTG